MRSVAIISCQYVDFFFFNFAFAAGAAHKPTHYHFGEEELAVTDLEKTDEVEEDADFD